MQSSPFQCLLDWFEEQKSVGVEISDKINAWNEANLDEERQIAKITPNMSGEEVVISYTENGIGEDSVARMLEDINLSMPEESDDQMEVDNFQCRDVDEHLNAFLFECIEIAHRYPNFIKGITLQEGTSQRKDEVRIVFISNEDLRKLPANNPQKSKFMQFLKDIREKAAHHSMLDEAFCFCKDKKEFIQILKPLALPDMH